MAINRPTIDSWPTLKTRTGPKDTQFFEIKAPYALLLRQHFFKHNFHHIFHF